MADIYSTKKFIFWTFTTIIRGYFTGKLKTTKMYDNSFVNSLLCFFLQAENFLRISAQVENYHVIITEFKAGPKMLI